MKINRKKKRFSQELQQNKSHLSPKLFKEVKFDSSSDDVLSEEDSLFKRIENVWEESSPCIESTSNITPSKSESGAFEERENLILSLESSHVLNDSSDWELQRFDNVLDELAVESALEESEIIPGWEDIAEESTPKPIKRKMKKCSATEESTPQPINKKVKKSSAKKIKGDDVTTVTDQLQCYSTPEGTVLVLAKNEIVYFHGLMKLTVLHGEIEVFGHVFTKDSDDCDLYSPRGSSLFYLKNITKVNIPIESYLPDLKMLNKRKLNENCAIVLCKRLEPLNVLFIEKHTSQQIFPKNDSSNSPRVVFQPEGLYNYLRPDTTCWNELVDNIKSSTVMFMCGGKGVGKSCFLRYVINRLLMKYNAVRVVDLDPGQSEFTVPGCISIVKVAAPIFGGSYSHLLETQRCIASNINIGYEPDRYTTAVKHLMNFSFEEDMPTLINFMGFTHGIGINILSAAIHVCRPTDVVQISSKNHKNNYKSALTPEIVARNAELFVRREAVTYNLIEIESMCDNFNGWIAEPRQLREMSILSYLSRMIDANSVFKTKGVLSRINLSDIKINDLSGAEIHPAVVNANLVALCSLEDAEDIVFHCFGWGIVRGIDTAAGYLVLLSETSTFLEKVTHIVFNGVTLPPSIYMTPDAVTGLVPYVSEGMLAARFGQMPKRARKSVKTK